MYCFHSLVEKQELKNYYYRLLLGLNLVVIAEMWEHSNIVTLMSNGARNPISETIRQVVNKPVA